MSSITVEKSQSLETLSSENSHEHIEHEGIEREDLLRIVFVGVVVFMGILKVPYFNVIGVVATLIGGFPIFEEAFSSLRERRMTMELSMSIALFAALAISEVFTALVITFFVLIAEALESLTVGRGRDAIKQLLAFLPQETFVRVGSNVQERKVNQIQLDEIVVVKPGARLPVDGVVVNGHSFVDQSTITGESMPSEKVIGSQVYAGTINQSGTIDVKPTGIGEDTAFGKIIHAVETAAKVQAPVQKTADRLAGYLVYFALGCAILTFLVTRNMNSTISVIIVAGACGIAAGTPLAILGGVGRAARSGAIVKGGLFLELLSEVDTIVFDKTGTLTQGIPEVVAVTSCGQFSAEYVLEIAASAEVVSEHPLAKAILAKAQREELTLSGVEDFLYVPGQGIKCRVAGVDTLIGNRSLFKTNGYDIAEMKEERVDASEVLVGQSGQLAGTIHISDILRNEAREAVRALKELGINTVLLTGDSKGVANAVASQTGITEVAAEVMPAEKQEFIKKLMASGKRVAMVGDGINDAPALIEANVGVAIGSGADVARESADVVLIGNDLLRLVETVKIARQCKRVIMTNFIGTLVVDAVGVGLAAFGFLNPLIGALIHVISELVFIMNSARLLPRKSD